jgi:hypothetical protein
MVELSINSLLYRKDVFVFEQFNKSAPQTWDEYSDETTDDSLLRDTTRETKQDQNKKG